MVLWKCFLSLLNRSLGKCWSSRLILFVYWHSSKDTVIYNSNENYSYKNLNVPAKNVRLTILNGGNSLSDEEKKKREEEMKKLEEEKKKIKEKDWDAVDWDEDME